jgi:cytoskeletal protein CcmA (bactofilin family)
MWKKISLEQEKEPSSPKESGGLNAYLDKGAHIEGKMHFKGSVRIDGEFYGEIVSDDLLVVGESGVIEGVVRVGEALISGKVKGTLEIKRSVTFNGRARFEGDLFTPNLVVEGGAVLNGKVVMEKSGKEGLEEIALKTLGKE